MWNKKNNELMLLISTQKGAFSVMMTLFITFKNDVITTDMRSTGIHLLNNYSFRHNETFSFLDKSTGLIMPLVVLPLYNMQFLTGFEGNYRTHLLPEADSGFCRMPDRSVDDCFVIFSNVLS